MAAPSLLTPVAALRDRVAGLGGRWRLLLALVLGGLTTLALPPVHAVPVLLVTLPLLLWLIDGTPRLRSAFLVGWVFGTGHFATGFYWIANALLIDPERFGWMIPFAVGGLGAFIGLFPGFAAMAARAGGDRGPARVLLFAAAWAALEWVRGWILTGFPWNPVASVWMPADAVLQTTALVGTYGLGLLTVFAFGSLALLGDRAAQTGRAGWATVVAAWAVLAVLTGWGSWRLAGAEVAMVPDATIRIVQPNIDQKDKWKADQRDANLMTHVELSQQEGFADLTAVIWPETAASFAVNTDEGRRRLIALAAPPGGVLVTGAPRITPQGEEPFQVWNSLAVIDDEADILATYDKMHLVPFGEYVPLRGILPIDKITPGSTDFSFGQGPRLIDVPGLPAAGPLVCYEVIFPGQIVLDGPRPGWLLNVTNDGWYGISAGPYQHFATSRLRAVEEGLPLVRAANTGISGIIDPYGRVVASLDLGVQGIIDGALPQALPPTPYARGGNAIALALAALLAGCALWLRPRRRELLDPA
ncbi:apolipoprotein N-acyltransferase [Caenispirillum bisanense]|uniref:Apolipoprotein N-acyltransferase n=1 Tax=Caenispirillum bisanense TaxID=414052 RepID=A0A286GUI8_9PROT|nr:apolipoprotein N-acyltransferase [Caenispirillum bisanense]SOD99205.1 Apolipoprotein N-acyltransferase [Caenispirillum bisanense]